MNRAVLVGIDGSTHSACALDWAAAEAAVRNAPLHLLHAFSWPRFGAALDPRRTEAWEGARRLLADSQRRAAELAPDTDVTSEIVMERAAAALIGRAAQADLVVVGTRGHGGFTGLIVGSVALQVAGHAQGSVAVVGVRARPPSETREVVVGVGDHPTTAAIQAAFEEAALHGMGLRALHAWEFPATTPGGMVPLVSSIEQIESAARCHLAGALAGWRDKHPEVPVVAEVVNDRARHALVQASSRAELLVVGTRDHHGRLSLPLGTVTHTVLHHATCPVLVARHR